MYMMPLGSHFTDVPDIGGPLTQWHIHNDLCLSTNPSDPLQKLSSGSDHREGQVSGQIHEGRAAPMIHVWITKNPCGPFASLSGEGGGQIPAGQQRLCDTQHGGGTGSL